MASNKNYYYVLVITDNGPVFVTGTGEHHTAYWAMDKEPKEFTRSRAEDITLGLGLNGYPSYTVVSPWKLDYQPYPYDRGGLAWVAKEENNDEE